MKTQICIRRWVVVLYFALLGACGGGGGNVDGPPGTIQLLQTSFNTTEGTIVNIRVARSDGNFGIVSVDYATTDGTAVGGSDYTAANGTLTWVGGVSGNQTISIPISDDNSVEIIETFTLTLSNVSRATLGSNSSATVKIIDND
jgi:hypothetical protein